MSAVLKGIDINFSILDLLKNLPIQILMTTPANHPNGSKTGVNPAWRSALWSVVYTRGWVKGIIQSMQNDITQKVHDALGPLRDLTPGGGSYTNEASIWRRLATGLFWIELCAAAGY